MNVRKNFRGLFGSFLLGATIFTGCPIFAQDEKTDEEALRWMEAVSKKVLEDSKNSGGAEFAKEALLKATKPIATDPNVRPIITEKSIDLDTFMARYRVDQGTMKDALKEPANFYVFVSFSMDIKAIQKLGRDTAKAGGTLVLRGLVNNSLPQTTAKLAELQGLVQGAVANGDEEDAASVNMIVDPTLYEKFRVDKVPSFVVTEALNDPCLDFDCVDKVPPYDRLSGLVSVRYALKTISEEGSEAKDHASVLLSRVEAQQW